jgi:UDP-4-amino-4,6-dideoxy-N-acetyl-beta-L-altrosamine transaminase
MIPYGRQDICQDDIDAVVRVLKSDYLTQGPIVPLFENSVLKKCGARHALAVNSATSALHIACLALGLGADDLLWTTPITFVASANCALYCGANVDFVDIDPITYNMCPDALERKLIQARREGRLPKIVVPVHLCGQPCDMQRIFELGQLFGFKIIEDASHAIGGKYLGMPIGNCQFSDITVFSFHPVKIITTAEGGMAVTNSDELFESMALLRSHGITRDQQKMTCATDGPWYYQQIALGFNYRMTEMQAALGVSQIHRLEEFVAARHAIAGQYDKSLTDLPLRLPWQSPFGYSAFHLYVIRVKTESIGRSHLEVFELLRELGVGVNLHYIPVHTQPFYAQRGFKPEDFPQAMKYYGQAISLPIFPNLTQSMQEHIVQALTTVLQ